MPSAATTEADATALGAGAVVVGGDNLGIVSTGPNATNTQYRTVLPDQVLRPVEEVTAPPGLVNVPLHDGVFVGRHGDLATIETILAGEGDAPLVVAAVHGLGGVGKSTLAARCAIRWSARAGGPHPVWWITADSASAVQAGLAGLATALQPELSEALPLEALAERAVAWLAAHRGWLLVLDNVTDPADVAMLLARRLKGRIVVTSRLAEGWHRYGAHLLRLDVLTEPQAVELLLRIADHLDADDGEAADLCRELGYLPLAVEQAAAYLHQTRLTPARYLEFLRDNPAVMYDQTARGSDAMRTIARIWRITLDSLADTPLAGHLLRTLAWWAPEAIPRTLLDPANPAKVTTALGALAAYNLVVLDADTVTVHRLVQAVARTPDPGDPHRRPTDIDFARYLATGLLNQARPHDAEDPARWPIWRALLPHIEALSDHTDPASDILVSADLLSWTARFLLSQEDVHRAIAYCERVLAIHGRLLGELHPETLTSRNNLAEAYLAAGNLQRAVPLFERTLAEREGVLGDDPEILASRNNLASAYLTAGDVQQAIPLLERVVADSERVLGDDHPRTLASRNNLAAAYRAAGDVKQGIPLFERALAERERELGEDHPDTLESRNNLAIAYWESGDVQRAIPLFERVVADSERVLGDDHPRTLTSHKSLAAAYWESGDVQRAIPLFERTLADSERVLGDDHPLTEAVRARLNMARE